MRKFLKELFHMYILQWQAIIKNKSAILIILALAKDLEEISFYDVYQAVGAIGDEGLFHFHEKPNMACPVGQNIHLMLDKRLQQVQEVMENELRQIKISDVVNEVNF